MNGPSLPLSKSYGFPLGARRRSSTRVASTTSSPQGGLHAVARVTAFIGQYGATLTTIGTAGTFMWRCSEWASEQKADMKDLRKDISSMGKDISSMDVKVSDLRKDISSMDVKVSNLQSDVTGIKQHLQQEQQKQQQQEQQQFQQELLSVMKDLARKDSPPSSKK
jgi:regulator of replication initiation timing